MTDQKGQSVSPYLMKPLRSFQQVLAERKARAAVQRQLQTQRKPQSQREVVLDHPLSRVA